MSVATTRAVALTGLVGTVVDVEAHAGAGLPAMVVIGMPDAALSQARFRVRSAASRIGIPLSERKMIVNLSPAALPKHGSAFDLAIAIACCAALRPLPVAEALASTVYIGELGLDGRVRSVPGVLPAVAAARAAGFTRVVVPGECAQEAALVGGMEVQAVSSLAEAAGVEVEVEGRASEPGAAASTPGSASAEAQAEIEPGPGPRGADRAVPPVSEELPELAEVVGNEEAVEALLIAAAGRHHLLMTGPPGVGKTMLARRLAALLPELDDEAALEASAIRSLSGGALRSGLVRRPPFESPHHTASAVAMIGGGSGIIRPGAAVRASGGVLFLDEAPEFGPAVLDSLRQPLEEGVVTVSRASAVATFPARFLLVLAANPCPCGNYGVSGADCACAPLARVRYLQRLSGPLLDRVDLRVGLQRVSSAQRRASRSAPSTAQARERVAEARARAAQRLRGTPWRTMGDVSGPWLRATHPLPADATTSADQALAAGRISMRGYDRVLRLAFTLADLQGRDAPGRAEVGRALFLRRGIPG